MTISETVTSIGGGAFRNCTSLTTLNYNATYCTTAGSASSPAFENCESLTSVNIGENVVIIPDYFVMGCVSITSICMPDGVSTIRNSAFSNCSGLTSVTIPSSVTSIFSDAFMDCSNLAEINSKRPTPPGVFDDTFEGVNYSTCVLNVPTGYKDAYSHSIYSAWRNFEIINEVDF